MTDGGYGGGIYNKPGGTIVSTNTTFDGNDAKFSGGGIYDFGGTITMTTSAVANNTASYIGTSHPPSAFSLRRRHLHRRNVLVLGRRHHRQHRHRPRRRFLGLRAGTATLAKVNFDGNTAD